MDSRAVIASSLFQRNVAPVQGGAIACVSCTYLNITGETKFQHNKAKGGGALFLSTDSATPVHYASSNTVFKQNHAINGDGGAASFNNVLTLLSLKSKFLDNHASRYGGALFLSYTIFSGIDTSCRFNTAVDGGGQCLYWNPDDSSNRFEKADADWFKFAPEISNMEMNDAATTDFVSSSSFEIKLKVPRIHIVNSRDTFKNPPSFEILNYYKIRSISMEMALMTVQLDNTESNGSAIMKGEINSAVANGTTTFETLSINTIPNTGWYKLSFEVPALPRLKRQELKVYVRACVQGEILTAGSEVCIVCEPGTYSLDLISSSCKLCPLGAVCRGGNGLKAITGYWRTDNTSDKIKKCRSPNACLGAIPPEVEKKHREPLFPSELTEHNESCSDGYYSKLCFACKAGYARKGKSECAPCPTNAIFNKFMMVLGGFTVCIVVIFMVSRTIKAGRKSPYFKDLAVKLRNATGAQRVTIFTLDNFNNSWRSRAIVWTESEGDDSLQINIPLGQDNILDDVKLRQTSRRETFLTFPGIQYEREDNIFPHDQTFEIQSCMVCPVFSDVNNLIGIIECVNRRHIEDLSDDEDDESKDDNHDMDLEKGEVKKKKLFFKKTSKVYNRLKKARSSIVGHLKNLKNFSHQQDRNRQIKCDRFLSPGGFTATDLKRLEILVGYNANGIQGEGKDMFTMALKIVNSYMQFIGLARGFRLDWPALLRDMFNSQSSVSTVGPKVLSLDCAIGTEPSTTPLYFRKFLASLCIPPFFLFGSLLFWGLYYLKQLLTLSKTSKTSPTGEENENHRNNVHNETNEDDGDEEPRTADSEYKKRKKELQTQVFNDLSVTLIVSLFLVQSSLTKETLAMFDCVEVEGGQMYINEALEVNCNEEPYSTWAKSAGTMSMTLYVIGIPLGAFFILFKNRKFFHDHQVLSRYGFLLNGYNVKTAWFWEVVIMGRKIITAIVAIFFARYGPIVQCQLAVLVILACISMHMTYHPYEFKALHNLELNGLISSFFTFYFGMYFLDENLSLETRFFVAVLVIALNVAFLTYFCYKMYFNMKSTVMRVLIKFDWRDNDSSNDVTSVFRKLFTKAKTEETSNDESEASDAAIKGLFYRYDSYFDGALGPDQVKKMMNDLCKDSDKDIDITDIDVQQFINHLDMDGDNEIQCNEFLLFINQGLTMDEEEKGEYCNQSALHQKIGLLLSGVDRHIAAIEMRKLKKAEDSNPSAILNTKTHDGDSQYDNDSLRSIYESEIKDNDSQDDNDSLCSIHESEVKDSDSRHSMSKISTKEDGVFMVNENEANFSFEMGDVVWVVQPDWGEEIYRGVIQGMENGNLYDVVFDDGDERFGITEDLLFFTLEEADIYAHEIHTWSNNDVNEADTYVEDEDTTGVNVDEANKYERKGEIISTSSIEISLTNNESKIEELPADHVNNNIVDDQYDFKIPRSRRFSRKHNPSSRKSRKKRLLSKK
jgi:predicted outer membrane repeat protein